MSVANRRGVGTLTRRGGITLAIAAVAIGASAQRAAAQRTVFQADGALNLGYNQTTRPVVNADGMPEERDIRDSSIAGWFTEIRPGIALMTGSPRLSWRVGYNFSANLQLADTSSTSMMGEPAPEGAPEMEGAAAADRDRGPIAYANAAEVALVAALTPYTTLSATGAFTQGNTTFLQRARRAELGEPDMRAPGNPSMLTGALTESLAWEIGRQWTLQQGLGGSMAAPQDKFDKRNSELHATLALERGWVRDTAGLEIRSSVSWLRPLIRDQRMYRSTTNGLTARWNHDFTYSWNASVNAGVEQVFTDTGSEPLAFLPSGGASVRYTVGNILAALSYARGTTTNLQLGSISLSDEITARGVITLDPDSGRSLAFSGGFLRNEPLGEVSSVLSAGTGKALQGDVSFTTQITKSVIANLRYSVAYQYDQAGSLGATLAHVIMLGVTATYNNLPPDRRPMPGRGLRVDQGDGFPVVELPTP
jgi:hypothetical protein